MSDYMTLSDILGRDVSMESFEGVALVRGVAARLLETSGEVPGKDRPLVVGILAPKDPIGTNLASDRRVRRNCGTSDIEY
jgi:hypothetical protein